MDLLYIGCNSYATRHVAKLNLSVYPLTMGYQNSDENIFSINIYELQIKIFFCHYIMVDCICCSFSLTCFLFVLFP